MTALVALSAAMIVGSADFLFGVAARRSGPLSVPLVGQVCGLVVLAASLVLVDAPEVHFEDLAWGALAGVTGAIAYMLFLAAMAAGQMSVVAPMAAATGATVPAFYGLGFEDGPGGMAVIGIGVAIAAIVLVSSEEPTEEATPPRAVVLAVLSGLFFGVFFVSLAFTSTDAGMWPLVASRSVSIPLLVVVNLSVNRGVRFDRSAFVRTAVAGVMEMVASMLILWALRRGPIAVAGVFGSLYPASTVLLAWMMLGERLRHVQKAGVFLALAAAALTAM